MHYVIVACSLAVGLLAFAMMRDAPSLSEPSFDYKTASIEERQAWMDGKAEKLRKAARFFLPSGRGPSALSFYLKDIVTRPESNRFEMNIDVKVPYGAEVGVIPKTKFLESFCKNYRKLGFYDSRINFVVNFRKKKDGSPISRISVEPYDCQYST